MKLKQNTLRLRTPARGFIEISEACREFVRNSALKNGVLTVFTAHTSCGLLISENADPAVRRDLERWMQRAVPDGDALFEHDAEGADDMPAHVRSVLTGVNLTIPVCESRLLLGTWQGIFLWEHRAQSHERRVELTLIGTESDA